ncbi:MAG: hypothetical protein NW205_06725 [Hyphomicrobiaceae bacterium]|nr:hypothetical protein [Hyphomicrobiaceae bacterium]
MMIAVAMLVLFVAVTVLAASLVSSDARSALAAAQAAPRHAAAGRWPGAFLAIYSGLLVGRGWLSRLAVGILASSLLYWYFALWLWATSGPAERAALVQLGFVWLLVGIAIGWPKDLVALEQACRLAATSGIVLDWMGPEAGAGPPRGSWLLRRLAGLALHALAITLYVVTVAFVTALLVFAALAAADRFDLAARIVGWSDELSNAYPVTPVDMGTWHTSLPAPKAGLYVALVVTSLAPLVLAVVFALSWSLTRWVYRYDRRAPGRRPFARLLLVGLPLAILVLPILGILVVTPLAIGRAGIERVLAGF